jgi:hypothetical protein
MITQVPKPPNRIVCEDNVMPLGAAAYDLVLWHVGFLFISLVLSVKDESVVGEKINPIFI